MDGVTFLPLFDYHPTFVAAASHPLANKDFVVAEDFRDQSLITYPVEKTRLDVFTEVLMPARIEPLAIRQVELTAVIVLLVASGRGVAVLPDWVVEDQKYNHDIVAKPLLSKKGVTRSLYAAVRTADVELGYIQDFTAITRNRQSAKAPAKAG